MAAKTFSGGDALEAKLQEIAKSLTTGAVVNVGFLEGGTYPDGTSVPEVAADNEFGVPAHGQPPRPYFRSMIAEKSPKWGEGVAKALKRTDYNAKEALDIVGQGIEGQLRKSITDLTSPPLAESTIAAKSRGQTARAKKVVREMGIMGPAKPLINTGHMLDSIDHEVK